MNDAADTKPLLKFPKTHMLVPLPSHRCSHCSALWKLCREPGCGGKTAYESHWHLYAGKPLSCCDNAPMLGQIVPLVKADLLETPIEPGPFKFDLGAVVFFIHDNHVQSGIVISRSLVENQKEHYKEDLEKWKAFGKGGVEYAIDWGRRTEAMELPEAQLYASKADLLAAL